MGPIEGIDHRQFCPCKRLSFQRGTLTKAAAEGFVAGGGWWVGSGSIPVRGQAGNRRRELQGAATGARRVSSARLLRRAAAVSKGEPVSVEVRHVHTVRPLPGSFGVQQQSQKANQSAWKFGTSTRCVLCPPTRPRSRTMLPLQLSAPAKPPPQRPTQHTSRWLH
jgi:hypothetical protein